MSKWLKVYKTFSGGRSKDDFIQIEKNATEETKKDAAIRWADNTPGGHSYGYRVYWEEIDHPPEEFYIRESKHLKYKIKSCQSLLKEYQKALKNKK